MPFIRGVARRVASEAHKSRVRHIRLDDAPESIRRDNPANDREEQTIAEMRLRCLEQCAARLSQGDQELMVDYYRYQGGQKIETKRKMAEALGVTLGALRVRAFRLRQQLEDCITQCMAKDSTSRNVFVAPPLGL